VSSTTRATATPITADPHSGVPGLLVIGPHTAGWRLSSERGFAVVDSPFELVAFFPGSGSPDSVEIDGVVFASDVSGGWRVSTPIDVEPGVNPIRVAVRHLDAVIDDRTILVTYIPEGDVQLVSIVDADTSSITVDYLYWDDDQGFPGPRDDQPGDLHRFAVDPNVQVVVHDTFPVDMDWLAATVTKGQLVDYPDWIPQYPYWITIVDGVVVEIWMVRLG
jgi:hypothetical protein